MTQYTKFTKNINYNENNYSNLQNGGINTPINHQNLTKVASRGSNMTGISTTNGSPALTLNTSNLPKPVLITNLNSSNISSLIKNERIKSSSIARSVTMRYNTNTKLQFDNSPNFSNPNSTTTNSNNNNNNNNNNQTANHFHYNRRSLQQTQSPPHQQQQQLHHQPLPQQHQQQIQLPLTSTNPNLSSVDTSLSNQQAKKEYLSLLSNIHRSQSIKLNRDKSNLSGFFNGLVNNREKTNNSNFNGGTSSNLANLNSNSNNSNNNTNNYLTLNSKFNSRKTQPFSLRNNNGSNSGLYNANNTSNNSINLNNSSDINYNNNSNTISKQISNSNNRLSEISKNSISLDNVYNGLDLIIANEHKYNKIENMTNNNNNNSINNNTNKSNNSLAYLNSKKSSNTPQIFASTHTHASNNSINFNFGNQNYSIDNSNNRVINELNLLKNKKRAQKLEIDEEITHNSSNINNNNNNNDENITKELSSSRSNHLKPNELNENDETNLLDEIEHYNKVASIHQNGIVAGVSMNESSLLKATNYFAKKVKPSKSELRHIKLNDESIYNNKISKLDLIDQLDIYQPKQTTNSINYLKVANKQLSGTSPSINHSHHPHHQLNNSNNNTAHSPVNRFKNELQLQQQQQQQQRNLIEYNNKTGSSLMLDSTTQSNKLNQSRSQLTRNHSRLSHITRDVNDSYAYTNVQQYIEENDLMPPEKAHSIKKWIIEVNSNYDDWEKKTVEKHIEDSFV